MNRVDPRPHGWKTIPLRYVCQLNPSIAFDGFDCDDDLTFLPMERIKSGYFIPNTDKYSKYGSSYTAFEDGDIVLAKVTPCFENGNIAIAEHLVGGKGFGSSELFVIRPTTAERRFLFYYFQSTTFKQDGEASMTGAGGLKRVSPDVLRQHRLPFPSQETQRLIADYLDRETARIDALIAEKEHMLALLEEKRAALISRVVTRGLDPTNSPVANLNAEGGPRGEGRDSPSSAPLKPSGQEWLGEIPAHWREIRMGHLVSLQGGATPATTNEDFWEGKIPWASPKDIKKPVLFDTIDHVSEQALVETNLSLINSPALLLVVRGMILAKAIPTSLMVVPMTINQDMKALRPIYVGISLEYLKLVFDGLQEPLSTLIEESAHGTRCLRTDMLTKFKIPVPPPEEQASIVKAARADQIKADELRENLRLSIALAKERRAALITAAVTGQIPLEEMRA